MAVYLHLTAIGFAVIPLMVILISALRLRSVLTLAVSTMLSAAGRLISIWGMIMMSFFVLSIARVLLTPYFHFPSMSIKLMNFFTSRSFTTEPTIYNCFPSFVFFISNESSSTLSRI